MNSIGQSDFNLKIGGILLQFLIISLSFNESSTKSAGTKVDLTSCPVVPKSLRACFIQYSTPDFDILFSKATSCTDFLPCKNGITISNRRSLLFWFIIIILPAKIRHRQLLINMALAGGIHTECHFCKPCCCRDLSWAFCLCISTPYKRQELREPLYCCLSVGNDWYSYRYFSSWISCSAWTVWTFHNR